MNAGATPPLTRSTLADLAHVVRSKNAGPTLLTIDVFLKDAAGFARVARDPALSCASVALLYGVDASLVQRYLMVDICAVKFVLPRRVCAGSPGDSDVYGAQQHVPMLGLELEAP